MPSRLPSPSLFGVGRFPRLFPIFLWTNVLFWEGELTELTEETRRLFGSPRLPNLLNLACLPFKALEVPCHNQDLGPLLIGRLLDPHLNPDSLCSWHLVQGVPCSQDHRVLEVLFLHLLQVRP